MAFINPENYGLYSNVLLGKTWFRSKMRTVQQQGWDTMYANLLKTFFKKVTTPYAIYTGVGPIEYLEMPICSIKDEHKKICNKKGLRFYLWEPLSTYDIRVGKNTDKTYVEYDEQTAEYIRSYELDSISQYVERNGLTDVYVYAPNSKIKRYFQVKYPNIQLDCLPVGWVYPVTLEVNEDDVDTDISKIEKKFWCGNWRYASHRHCIASYLVNTVDPKDYNLSWIYKSTSQILLNNKFAELPRNQILLEGSNKLGKLSPLAMDVEIDRKYNIDEYVEINMDTNPAKHYKESLVAIVNETRFAEMTPLLTEKIMNAMLNCRPFIMVGPPGNLAYMKRWGFSTFGDIIDESYDNELDHATRLDMIFTEIDKIANLTYDQMIDFYAEAIPNCVHNFYHILDLQEKLIGNIDETGKLKNVAINKNKNWKRIRDVD